MSEHRTTLIEKVKDTLNLASKADANRCIQAVASGIAEIVSKEGKSSDFRFSISELGIFKSKDVPQQNRRDPRTGAAVVKEARVKVTFRLAKDLREVGIKKQAKKPAVKETPAKAAKK